MRSGDVTTAVMNDILETLTTGRPQGFAIVLIVVGIGAALVWGWRKLRGEG